MKVRMKESGRMTHACKRPPTTTKTHNSTEKGDATDFYANVGVHCTHENKNKFTYLQLEGTWNVCREALVMRIFCTQLVTPSSGYCPVFQVDLAALKQAGGSGSTGTGTDAASSVKRRNSTTTNGHSRKSSSVQVIKQPRFNPALISTVPVLQKRVKT